MNERSTYVKVWHADETYPRNDFSRNVELSLLSAHDPQSVRCIHVLRIFGQHVVEELVAVFDVALRIAAQIGEVHVAERKHGACVMIVLWSAEHR